MLFVRVNLENHRLTTIDVGSVFIYENEKFILAPAKEMTKRSYGNWTIVSKIIDENNFECWSGEEKILSLGQHVFTEDR